MRQLYWRLVRSNPLREASPGWPLSSAGRWREIGWRGFAEAATLPQLVAGGMLIAGVRQGLYVEAGALFICIVDGVLDACVLLVEILR
jgi:hypothetical protein